MSRSPSLSPSHKFTKNRKPPREKLMARVVIPQCAPSRSTTLGGVPNKTTTKGISLIGHGALPVGGPTQRRAPRPLSTLYLPLSLPCPRHGEEASRPALRAVRADGGALPPVGALSAPARGGVPTRNIREEGRTPRRKDRRTTAAEVAVQGFHWPGCAPLS